MKNLYSILIAIFAFIVFVQPVAAGTVPAWDQKFNTPARFKVLGQFGGDAVFDKETGLVWEQSPDSDTRSWSGAQEFCIGRTVGDRKGWRLPTAEELGSLVAPGKSNPALLNNGDPFDNVQNDLYWTATTAAFDTGRAWAVNFGSGLTQTTGFKSSSNLLVWCVRGGQGLDGK